MAAIQPRSATNWQVWQPALPSCVSPELIRPLPGRSCILFLSRPQPWPFRSAANRIREPADAGLTTP